jgi:UDPglucose--hexose-1-phosphate uridylyltransferase
MSSDHQRSLSAAADGDLDDLAAVLQAVLLGLERGFAEPDYNLVLHTTPPRLAPPGRAYWLLQLIPRLGTAGGLELGTGVYINSLPPEEAASHLGRWAGG